MLTSQSRMIDEMIDKYSKEIEKSADNITTDAERFYNKRFYNNGLNAGKIEAYQEVIEDLKKLKEM